MYLDIPHKNGSLTQKSTNVNCLGTKVVIGVEIFLIRKKNVKIIAVSIFRYVQQFSANSYCCFLCTLYNKIFLTEDKYVRTYHARYIPYCNISVYACEFSSILKFSTILKCYRLTFTSL